MFVATIIVSALLAAGLLGSAVGKVRKADTLVATLTKVGVPEQRIPLLAIPEVAGALGLLAGLYWWPIGVAAAIGVILYFVSAVTAHLRVRDKGFGPAAFFLVLAVAALVLRLMTN